MIYLFYGNFEERARSKAFEWVAKARDKEPNLVYLRILREELSDSALEEAAFSGGLFVKRLLVLIDDPFANVRDFGSPSSDEGLPKSQYSSLESYLDQLAESDNAIVVLAPNLPAAKAKKIIAKSSKTYEYNKPPQRDAVRGFNTALVNALGTRSREKLWLEINRALRAGDPPEMIHGLLHWKARATGNRDLSMALIALLQDSRRKGLDLSESLERFALSV